jgi:hypothetical protein
MTQTGLPQAGNDSPIGPIVPYLGFFLPALAGTFAYRFNGHVMAKDHPFYLLGVGHLRIDSHGTITGEQRSATTKIEGQGATVMAGDYTLWGKMNVNPQGTGDAEIFFTKKDGQGLDVLGKFYLQVAGNLDQFWMISSGALQINSKEGTIGSEAVELASLEFVRMALPSP